MVSDRARCRSSRRFVALAVMVTFGVLAPGSAFADPSPAERETARALMNEGDRRYNAKDYEQALKAYDGANAIMGVPTTAMGVARAQVALGHLVEARDAAILVIRMPAKPNEPMPFVHAREAADKLARELESRIASIQVAVSGPPPAADVRVTLDDQVVARPLLKLPLKTNPGKHVLRASFTGFEDASAEVMLQEGENASVSLGLKASSLAPAAGSAPVAAGAAGSDVAAPAPAPATAAPRHPHWPLVWAGFGVGAVGLVTGTVTGLVHLSKISSIKQEYCDGGTACRLGYQAQVDSAAPTATVSTIAFAVGVAGVGAGIVGLLWSAPSGESSTAEHAGTGPWLSPEIGLGSLGVRGGF